MRNERDGRMQYGPRPVILSESEVVISFAAASVSKDDDKQA